ncbi:Appr-1-p processing protein [bacterium]|nr:MAG: Appr-1-p processing protein [bacterium]
MTPPTLYLTAVERPLFEAWIRFCGELPFVQTHMGSIFDVECQAVVSPANSFGFMDGGIDMLYSRHFGWGVQKRLQEIIREEHGGELLVGNAAIVPTNDAQIPYVISAPTMRVPMILRDSVNPYLAARAVLRLWKTGNFPDGTPIRDEVKAIAFPGLGTGVGQVGFDVCAHQVRAAIDEVLLETNEFPRTWGEASSRHQQLYTDRARDLQRHY